MILIIPVCEVVKNFTHIGCERLCMRQERHGAPLCCGEETQWTLEAFAESGHTF